MEALKAQKAANQPVALRIHSLRWIAGVIIWMLRAGGPTKPIPTISELTVAQKIASASSSQAASSLAGDARISLKEGRKKGARRR